MNIDVVLKNTNTITKSPDGEYWVDSSNNRWPCGFNTKLTASILSLKMMGCRDCINCTRMLNCIGCRGCYNMVDCIRCDNCTGLVGASGKSQIFKRFNNDN